MILTVIMPAAQRAFAAEASVSRKGEGMGLVSRNTIITCLVAALAAAGASPSSTGQAASSAPAKTASKLCTFRIAEMKWLLSAPSGGVMRVRLSINASVDGFPVASRQFVIESGADGRPQCDPDMFERIVVNSDEVGSVQFAFGSAGYEERDAAARLYTAGSFLCNTTSIHFAADHKGNHTVAFSRATTPNSPCLLLTCEVKPTTVP